MEERLQLAVFIDFDNIEIGVKTTLNTELDLSLVLEALKERGEVVSKSAYGDWARAGMHSRTLTDHAVHMVQRNVTPRGDKNGADINLVVDALEMAFTRPHINGFAIVGGDSDFIALVEKLKQFGKRVFVVGGRSFTSGILQRNCHEFISYENLLSASRSGRGGSQTQRRGPVSGRLPLDQGAAQVQRALKILADRGVEPQLGPLKSTLLQLDSTFSERDYGVSSFREFVQRLDDQGHLHLRRIDQGYLVELNGDGAGEAPKAPRTAAAPRGGSGAGAERRPAARGTGARTAEDGASGEAAVAERREDEDVGEEAMPESAPPVGAAGAAAVPVPAGRRPVEEALALLRGVIDRVADSRGGKPMYVRHLAQGLRAADATFDEQAFGFRTLTELMHLGQREGILRMQRDRQGAWRISAVGATEGAAAAPAGSEDVAVEPRAALQADEADAVGADRRAEDVEATPAPSSEGTEADAAETPGPWHAGAGQAPDDPPQAGGLDVSAEPHEPTEGAAAPTRRRRGSRAGSASKPSRTSKVAKPAARAPRPRSATARRKTPES